MLIKSYSERIARRDERKYRLLKFLRDETWTGFRNVQLLLDTSVSTAHKTIVQLENDGFVIRYPIRDLKIFLFGITNHGIAFSWDHSESVQRRPVFEPSKISTTSICHRLDVQFVRICAERNGWCDWRPESLIPSGMNKKPDAIALAPSGNLIAIELERTIKSYRRYENIYCEYLLMIKAGKISGVIYVVKDDIYHAFSKVFLSIDSFSYGGERVKITDSHRSKFRIYKLSDLLTKVF